MDITIPKASLLPLVARAAGIAQKRGTLPALANVVLTAVDGTVEVKATDLYMSFAGACEARVRKVGAVAVPGRDLLDRIKAMPDGPLSLVSDDGIKLVIKSVGSARRFTISGIPAGEMPELPAPLAEAKRVEIPSALIVEACRQTVFAVATDETRPNLNSALWTFTPGKLLVVATDGHRLCKWESDVSHDTHNTLLFPLRAVQEIAKLAADAGETMTVIPTEPNAFFVTPSGTFGVRLVDAVFLNWKQAVPTSATRIATVPRQALADAVRAVGLSSSNTGGVVLEFDRTTIAVRTESPEKGEAIDVVACEYDGKPLTMGVAAKYILDALGAIDGDDVTISMGDELAPIVIRPAVQGATRDYLAVVMPMRV